jgi:hypothetical protein
LSLGNNLLSPIPALSPSGIDLSDVNRIALLHANRAAPQWTIAQDERPRTRSQHRSERLERTIGCERREPNMTEFPVFNPGSGRLLAWWAREYLNAINGLRASLGLKHRDRVRLGIWLEAAMDSMPVAFRRSPAAFIRDPENFRIAGDQA